MIALLFVGCVVAGGAVGFLISSMVTAAKLQDASDCNSRLIKVLREASGHFRMAGLNSSADLVLKAIKDERENFPC